MIDLITEPKQHSAKRWIIAACILAVVVLMIVLICSQRPQRVTLPNGEEVTFSEFPAPEGRLTPFLWPLEEHNSRELTEEETHLVFGELPCRVGASFSKEDGSFLGLGTIINECHLQCVKEGIPATIRLPADWEDNSVCGIPIAAGYCYIPTAPPTDPLAAEAAEEFHFDIPEQVINYFVQFRLDGYQFVLDYAVLDERMAVQRGTRELLVKTAYAIIEHGVEELHEIQFEPD